MPHFIPDETYARLQDDLREAARTTEWRGEMAMILACADILPERSRGDFPDYREQGAA
jgi:hypothetical protein